MQNDTFSNRLRKALNLNHMTQTQLCQKTGLDKSLISNYLSGNYKAKQDKVTLLANCLNVSEAWLMGFDVEIKEKNDCHLNEIEVLLAKNKDILTKDDEDMIKFIIEKRKREVDSQEEVCR